MLYSYQKELLEKNPPRWLLAWGTGTGKTRTAITLANKNAGTALVVCPKSLKENWHREIQKWNKATKFTVLSKEEFKKYYKDLGHFDAFIGDEAHYWGNARSQLYEATKKFIIDNNIKFRWFLTATPYLSTPWNIFNLAALLGIHWNWAGFDRKFFYRIPMGRKMIPKVRPNMEEEVAKLVNSIGSTVRLEDVAEVPEQTFDTKFFSLTKDQEKGIKEIEESNFIAKFTRQHQIENGGFYDEYIGDTLFETSKEEYIDSLLEEHKKIAIFCRYNLQIEMLRMHLEIGNTPIYIINGDVGDKDSIVQAVNKSEKCIVLINAACSEGYELPSIGVIVYASLSFSLKDYVQSQGRFLRANALKKNLYIHLVSGEVDEAVYDAIMKKQDFHMEIFTKKS